MSLTNWKTAPDVPNPDGASRSPCRDMQHGGPDDLRLHPTARSVLSIVRFPLHWPDNAWKTQATRQRPRRKKSSCS